jgi:hypothetical protein
MRRLQSTGGKPSLKSDYLIVNTNFLLLDAAGAPENSETIAG